MKEFTLLLTSKLLIKLLFPLGKFYAYLRILTYRDRWSRLKDYMLETAISNDQHGNVVLQYALNDFCFMGYKAGNSDETISSVVGKNVRDNTLKKPLGVKLNNMLNKFEKDHGLRSIEEKP